MAENMAQSFQQLNEQLEAQHQQQQRRPLSFNSNGGAAAAAAAARVSPEHENGRTFTAEEAVVRDKSSAVKNKNAPSGAERSDR